MARTTEQQQQFAAEDRKTGRSLLDIRVTLRNGRIVAEQKQNPHDTKEHEMTHFIALRTTGGHELLLNIAHIVSVVQDLDDVCSIWTSVNDGQCECYHVHGTASGILELINLLQRGN